MVRRHLILAIWVGLAPFGGTVLGQEVRAVAAPQVAVEEVKPDAVQDKNAPKKPKVVEPLGVVWNSLNVSHQLGYNNDKPTSAFGIGLQGQFTGTLPDEAIAYVVEFDELIDMKGKNLAVKRQHRWTNEPMAGAPTPNDISPTHSEHEGVQVSINGLKELPPGFKKATGKLYVLLATKKKDVDLELKAMEAGKMAEIFPGSKFRFNKVDNQSSNNLRVDYEFETDNKAGMRDRSKTPFVAQIFLIDAKKNAIDTHGQSLGNEPGPKGKGQTYMYINDYDRMGNPRTTGKPEKLRFNVVMETKEIVIPFELGALPTTAKTLQALRDEAQQKQRDAEADKRKKFLEAFKARKAKQAAEQEKNDH